jgi:hypothetical protein
MCLQCTSSCGIFCLLFRNFFALAPQQLQAVLEGFQKCLSDDKLEMRMLASGALAGLSKVLPEPVASELRTSILSRAATLFPRKRQHAKNPERQLLAVQRHASVLALRALLNGSPHVIKDWYAFSPKR